MSMRRIQRRRPTDTVMLSGWLFADLLLAVSVIFLSTARGVAPESLVPTPTAIAIAPSPTPTASPTGTPAPSPTMQECRPVPSKQKIPLDNIGSGHGKDPTDDELRAAFRDRQSERAFVVITFPHYRTGQEEESKAKAAEINDRLRSLLPSIFTEDTALDVGRFRDDTDDGQRKVDFWIWFRVDSCT